MGNGNKHPIPNKVEFPVCHPTSRGFLAYALSHVFLQPPPVREKRRPRTRTRSQSTDSDGEPVRSGDAALSQSPQSATQSPRSDTSPAPSNWTASQEQAAQEAYEVELADQYIYDLMRLFASATRALAMYNTSLCMEELDKLPHVHQRSPYVMAMVGKAHYERTDYTSVRTHPFCSPPCNTRLYHVVCTGRTRLSGSAGTGPLSTVGYGGVLDPVMASSTDGAIVVLGARASLDRATFITGVDSDRKHILVAEGTVAGANVLSACPANGPYLRVRVHACGARVH